MSSLLDDIRVDIDEYLERDLSIQSKHSRKLVEAMRYAVLGGGKRLRGTLVVATAKCLGSRQEIALPAAAGVEYMHAYSLVHDDLPDMDDSPLRRGQASCHAAFGSTTAILAGDALQALAFSSIADSTLLNDSTKAGCISALARAAGWRHMVGGQAMDMEQQAEDSANLSDVRMLAQAKTGALFRACLEMGCLIGGRDESSEAYRTIARFGLILGEAFQAVDDYLDATQMTEEIGKPSQADQSAHKSNYVSVLGAEGARNFASTLMEASIGSLQQMKADLTLLEAIAEQCVSRFK